MNTFRYFERRTLLRTFSASGFPRPSRSNKESKRTRGRAPSLGLHSRRIEPVNTISRWLVVSVLVPLTLAAAPPVTPLPNAHAHNDYEHTRPLFDALDQGFGSVEADIYLVEDHLLVAHDRSQVKPERTLQALYLEPLRARVKANKGRVHPGLAQFYLLIDIKTDAVKTYEVLRGVLKEYGELFTVFRADRTETNAVTAVISGNRPRELLAAEDPRLAALDGRLPDLEGPLNRHVIPWISESWSSQFKWRGAEEMPNDELDKLRKIVSTAHAQGRKVRFWGAPDDPQLWHVQLAVEVDLINTDKLAELRKFLMGVSGAPSETRP